MKNMKKINGNEMEYIKNLRNNIDNERKKCYYCFKQNMENEKVKRKLKILPPFFEIGPKNYLFGQDIYDLAKAADEAAKRHNVNVIFTAPYVNIAEIVKDTKNLYVFAPHMDATPVGRGLANVLPESIKGAGARGVMLNHIEKPLAISELSCTINRAASLDLMTIVCAASIIETKSVAMMKPDMIVSEPAELIGTGQAADVSFVKVVMDTVLSVQPDTGVLVAGGVSTGEDAYNIIYAGADATGSSSGIVKAPDPEKKIHEMLEAVRQAWDDRTCYRKGSVS